MKAIVLWQLELALHLNPPWSPVRIKKIKQNKIKNSDRKTQVFTASTLYQLKVYG